MREAMTYSGHEPINDQTPIDSRRLLIFCSVVDAGTVAAAARYLCLTRSALSHALKTLEDELGCKLFIRHQYGIAITEAGRKLLPQARAILKAMAEARESLA